METLTALNELTRDLSDLAETLITYFETVDLLVKALIIGLILSIIIQFFMVIYISVSARHLKDIEDQLYSIKERMK